MSNNRKLTRSHNSMLGGVCAGVAEYTNADVNIIRLIVVLATIFGLGSMILVYIVAWVILPLPDQPSTDHGPVPPSV